MGGAGGVGSVLAIVGGTNTGKSMLAAVVLQRIGKLLGLAEFVEVTVEDDGHLDASDFIASQHAGILLDGVGFDDLCLLLRGEVKCLAPNFGKVVAQSIRLLLRLHPFEVSELVS